MATAEATPPQATPSAPHPATLLAARLDGVLLGMLALVAAKVRILGDSTIETWHRISHIRQRLARLLEAVAQGRPPRQRATRSRPAAPRPRPVPAPPQYPTDRRPLPFWRRKLALVVPLGWEAACCGSQLQHVLDDPACQAALADAIALSPGIGRSLRPLCRIFGVALPPCLQLPPHPPRPRPQRKPRPRTPKPPGLLPTDHPLPAYVRAAVRAWKPRKIRPA